MKMPGNLVGGGGMAVNGAKETYNIAAGQSIKRGDPVNLVTGYNGGKDPVDVVPVQKSVNNDTSSDREYYLNIPNTNYFVQFYSRRPDGSSFDNIYADRFIVQSDGTASFDSSFLLVSGVSVYIYFITARILDGRVAIFYEQGDSGHTYLSMFCKLFSFDFTLIKTSTLYNLSTWGGGDQTVAVCVYDTNKILFLNAEWTPTYILSYISFSMDSSGTPTIIKQKTNIETNNEYLSIRPDNIYYNTTTGTIVATYIRKASSVWQTVCINMLKTNPSSYTQGILISNDSSSFRMHPLSYTDFLFVLYPGTYRAAVVTIGSSSTVPAFASSLVEIGSWPPCIIDQHTFCTLKIDNTLGNTLKVYSISATTERTISAKESFSVSNAEYKDRYSLNFMFNINYQYGGSGMICLYAKYYPPDITKAQFAFIEFVNGIVDTLNRETQVKKALTRPFDGIALKSGNGAAAIPDVLDAVPIATLPAE